MFILMNVDYRRYKHPAIVFSLLGLTTALLVAVFFLDRAHNTHRWIRFAGFSLQPSELAKPAIILFMAYFLEERLKAIDDWRRTLLPAVVPSILLSLLIVKEPDLGTAMACMGITASIMFVAGMELKYLGYAFAASLLPLYFLIMGTPWRRRRILAFLDPYADPQGSGFHMIQSLIAVGTGGITGIGLMEGKQKLFYLPEPHTDFIFAVTSEELGLIGSIFVVALFGIFLWRGIRAALKTSDPYARLLATGVTSMIVVQALFNISVVLGMLPTKGIPLPFISYGGSSLAISLASVGILLNITQQTD
jgi:cell division protein FtsW